MIIEISVILSLELLVIMYAMLFDMLPGMNYRMHKPEIQLIMVSISFILGVVNQLVVTIKKETIMAVNSLMDPEFLMCYLGFFLIVLLCSIYKYVDYKKNGGEIIQISLKATDYTLRKDVDFLMNELSMTNIKRIAICPDYIIIFSASAPIHEIDANFYCRKIGNNQYECISFSNRMESKNLRHYISSITGYMLLFFAAFEVILLNLIGHEYSFPIIHVWIVKLFYAFGMYILGITTIKLFGGTSGLTKFIFVPFGLLVIFVGFIYLFN